LTNSLKKYKFLGHFKYIFSNYFNRWGKRSRQVILTHSKRVWIYLSNEGCRGSDRVFEVPQ